MCEIRKIVKRVRQYGGSYEQGKTEENLRELKVHCKIYGREGASEGRKKSSFVKLKEASTLRKISVEVMS